MPRNASGVYTLPAGNPVVSSTPIETSWANPTLTDIGDEITNSLDRQGRGGMLVPFQNVDGTTPAPGITFTSEPTMGFFRNGPGDMQATVAGIPQMRWQSTGVQVWAGAAWANLLNAFNPLRMSNGSAAAPSFSFANDVDTGVYLVGAGNLGFAVGGASRMTISSAAVSPAVPVSALAGTAGAPSFSFTSDLDTGMYLNGVGNLALTVAGTRRLSMNSSVILAELPVTAPVFNATG